MLLIIYLNEFLCLVRKRVAFMSDHEINFSMLVVSVMSVTLVLSFRMTAALALLVFSGLKLCGDNPFLRIVILFRNTSTFF